MKLQKASRIGNPGAYWIVSDRLEVGRDGFYIETVSRAERDRAAGLKMPATSTVEAPSR